MTTSVTTDRKHLAILLFCAVLSGTGTGITLIAINWVLLEKFQSSAIIGSLIAISYIVSFIMLPVVSSFIDRFDKALLMRNVNIFGAFMQITTIALLQVFSDSMLIIAFGVITILSVVIRMTDQMVRIGLGQTIVAKKDYASLSKKLEICRQAITFLSGGFAAYFLINDNLKWILIADALTFIIAALLFWQLSKNIQRKQAPKDDKQPSGSAPASRSVMKDIKFTLSYIRNDKVFFYLNLLAMMPYSLVMAQNTLYPAHIEQLLNLDAGYYALMSIPFGLGAFFAPMLSTFLGRHSYNAESKIMIGFCLFCFANVGIFVVPHIFATYACLFIFAAGHAMVRIERLANMMHVVEEDKIGRIAGFYEFFGIILVVIFSLAVGFFADYLGVVAAWIFMLIVAVFALVCLLLIRQWVKKSASAAKQSSS